MDRPNLQFIPASLVRIRCFMNTSGRMKAKPWATAGETLDAFHDMLRRQHGNDAFWKDLEKLLAALTRDVEKRMSTPATDNELLDPARHAALLAEIRSSLPGSGGGFRKLASRLSTPAVALLLLLGGTTAVGCGPSTSLEGDADATTEPATDPVVEPAADPAVDHCDEILADIAVDVEPCDVEMDGEECLHACKSFEEIVVECVPEEPYPGARDMRCEYIDCINTMHESWRTGLTEAFACMPCHVIDHLLSCNLWVYCEDPADPELDIEEFLDACHCCLYLGVRME
jgi:hypothetical protein